MRGLATPGLTAADFDCARVGAQHAREDGDQCRLAGAVLAEQRVNLPRVNGKRHFVVGNDSGETLGDVPQHDDRLRRVAGAFKGAGRHGQTTCSPSNKVPPWRPLEKGAGTPGGRWSLSAAGRGPAVS